MSATDRDWSDYEPTPQETGAFARTLAATPPERGWDDYAEVEEIPVIAAPYGWLVPLVESRRTDGEEAAAFAQDVGATLRDELGEPVERATVRGYTGATWLDAVAVALGGERLLTWRVDDGAVALVEVAVLDSRDLWLVVATPEAAEATLPVLLGDDGTVGADDDPIARALRWLEARRIDLGIEPGASLDGWFPPGTPTEEVARLTPFATVDGSGAIGATWTDDTGETLVVVLGSEGDAHVLADSPLDLVRLLGVGYDELGDAGGPVDGAFGSLRAAVVRAWVEETFDVTVPREWVAGGPDEFSEWVARLLGDEVPEEPAPTGGLPRGAVAGDVAAYLDALGRTDAVAVVADRLGLPATTTETELERLDIDLNLGRRGLQQLTLRPTRYPRPDRLLEGVPLTSTLDDLAGRWGAPERQHPEGAWARWVVGGRWLHLAWDDEGIGRVTVMLDAP